MGCTPVAVSYNSLLTVARRHRYHNRVRAPVDFDGDFEGGTASTGMLVKKNVS